MGRRFGKTRRGRTFRERRTGRGFQDPPDDLFLAEAWHAADDAVLCHAANEGVAAGFDALYARYRTWIFLMALGLVGDLDDALTLFQDVFLLWFSRFPGFTPRPSVKARLYAFIRTRAATLRALRMKVIPLEPYRRRQPHERNGARSTPPPLPPRGASLAGALSRFPPELREIALLRFGAGMRGTDMVDALDLPLETIRLRMETLLGLTASMDAKTPRQSPKEDPGEELPAPEREDDRARPWSRSGPANAPGNHPLLLEIDAALHGDIDLLPLDQGGPQRLEDVRGHIASCQRCRQLQAAIQETAHACLPAVPVTIPEDVEHAILLEGHLRAAAIVRRALDAQSGDSISAMGADDAGMASRAHTTPARGDVPERLPAQALDDRAGNRAPMIALPGGVGTRAPLQRVTMILLATFLLVATVFVVGWLRLGNTETPAPSSWHDNGVTPTWPSSD